MACSNQNWSGTIWPACSAGVKWEASQPAPSRVGQLDLGCGLDGLERRAGDGAGGECLPADDHGLLGHDDAHVRLVQLTPVEDPEALALDIGRFEPAIAEGVFAAHVEREIGAHLLAVAGEEGQKAAEVVVVAMAEDERVDVRRVDLEERHVVDAGRLRQAVVEEVVAGLASLGGLQVEAEAELALKLLRVQVRAETEPVALHLALQRHVADGAALEEDVVGVVDERPHRKTVHDRRSASQKFRGSGDGVLLPPYLSAVASDESPGENRSPDHRTEPQNLATGEFAALVHLSSPSCLPKARQRKGEARAYYQGGQTAIRGRAAQRGRPRRRRGGGRPRGRW